MPLVNTRDMFKKAYEGVSKIHFQDMHYRRDIGIK